MEEPIKQYGETAGVLHNIFEKLLSADDSTDSTR
jgi:hypothetical protein